MKVLVLGGAGYIGSHVVLELVDNKHEVIVFDNLSTGHKEVLPKEVKFYLGDIKNKKDLEKVFLENKIDVVMDFAALIVVPESMTKPLEYYHNNLEGVRLILESMKDHGVKNLVFSSTAAVYGEPVNDVCNENDLTLPINPYGESKLGAEKLIRWASKAYGINHVIFRYFNVAGADKDLRSGLISKHLTHIVPIVTEGMLKIRKNITVYGNDYPTRDGSCIRDYIHVVDLAHAHVLGAKYLLEGNKSVTMNLGSNEGYSVLELIKVANEIASLDYVIGERRPGDPAKLIASNQIAKEVLGWKPEKSLHDMVLTDYNFRKRLNNK